MRAVPIDRVVSVLRRQMPRWKTPIVGVVAEETRDPFRVLVSCLLSLRTKDQTTEAASRRLFRLATTPAALAGLPTARIEKAIYPVGFYRTKARTLKSVSRDLIDRFDSVVPDDLEGLLSLKGVGRKTANLVMTLGHRKYGICVDVHVHRISNRLGYVRTKNPEQTEMALRRKLPKRYWLEYNDLLVTYGQNVCKPVSPICSGCSISRYCNRIGVRRSR